MGQQAVEVTAELAGGRAAPASGELLYTDFLGLTLVTLPLWLGLLMLGGLLLGFAWLTWRRRSGTLRGIGALLLAMADAALTAYLLHKLIGWLRPGEYWRAYPEWLSMAIDATAIVAAATALLWLSRGVARERLRAAYWLAFLILGAAICLKAPGAAIYFLLPPLLAGIGLLWPRLERAATGLSLLVLFVTWVPLLHLSHGGSCRTRGCCMAAGGAGSRLFRGAQAAAELRISLGRARRQGAAPRLPRPRAGAQGVRSPRAGQAGGGGAVEQLQALVGGC
jgi:hypothetical protein